ncbi:TRAP transporter small permease [Chloroflexota bacterium]
MHLWKTACACNSGASKIGRTVRFLRLIGAGIEWMSMVSGALGVIVLAAMAAVVFYSVIMRYVFFNAPHWETNWASYSILFISLVPAAYTLKEGQHITVDLIFEKLSSKGRAVVEITASIISLLFCFVFAVAGWNLVKIYHSTGHVSQDVLEFPLYIVQIFIPVAAVLLGLQYMVKLARNIRALRVDVDVEDTKHEY